MRTCFVKSNRVKLEIGSSTIITSNKLKINNHSTDIPQDYKFILTQDAIFTIALLNGFDDLNGEAFILPQQVKTAMLSKLTDKLCQLQEKTFRWEHLFARESIIWS